MNRLRHIVLLLGMGIFFAQDPFIDLTYDNVTTTGVDINYESNTEISGFQFDVDGVTITGANGGAAEGAGFMITSGATTIIGFSLQGETIPSGSGTLLSLEFEEISGETNLEVINVIIPGPEGSSIPNSGPGSTALQVPPELFSYNQSTLQASYFFELVIINEIEIDTNDWVGAFKGNICVGSRKWDTSQCGGGVCDVSVMG
ncbi:uncharacterized protein METZ01_LOCUS349824, partial [marine metagenome]